MPPFGPVKRKELIRHLKQLGFEGPYSGGKHQFMVRGETTIRVPNPHQGDVGRELLARILRQAGISKEDWERL
ncbi:MAG: type II toxin-antitoxin system HicA family toxin [Syntrophobacteraceae bacterium]|nr:type II toxin-antitoxin system HicA family toxin [Syntrophobacteraceae bacterium]